MPNPRTFRLPLAQVVKLVDTLASGASGRKAVAVQVRLWAPLLLFSGLVVHPRITAKYRLQNDRGIYAFFARSDSLRSNL